MDIAGLLMSLGSPPDHRGSRVPDGCRGGKFGGNAGWDSSAWAMFGAFGIAAAEAVDVKAAEAINCAGIARE